MSFAPQGIHVTTLVLSRRDLGVPCFAWLEADLVETSTKFNFGLCDEAVKGTSASIQSRSPARWISSARLRKGADILRFAGRFRRAPPRDGTVGGLPHFDAGNDRAEVRGDTSFGMWVLCRSS
jgi:hypothetical protein